MAIEIQHNLISKQKVNLQERVGKEIKVILEGS